ncbi:MAG: UDP-N-acetylmuramoyl-L-alanyl-D-glutamate--2,6-diaminopimelate ligase [Gammaproteobacteria bacterium]|nr:UDP-N-acetylmuramoyl-L-alanyl-D-glutamate--2,6-diaminopimelate ligase [Gammaproteobacteria bacterium]
MMTQPRPLAGPTLATVLQDVMPVAPERDQPLQGLALDSRKIQPGFLFLAVRGHDHHGLQYLADARRRGAIAVAYDPEGAVQYLPGLNGLPAFAVRELARQAGPIAAHFYADPSAAQSVIAVTGTNGKTSVSLLSAQTLTQLGKPCGLLGTLGYGVYGHLQSGSHTTPDAVSMQGWLARFRDARVHHVSLEASSHALDQGRLNGVHFSTAVFTNLTRDHLDYHRDMQAYGAAKRRLFEMPGLRHAVINLDDAFGRELAAGLPPDITLIGYGLENRRVARGQNLQATQLKLSASGTQFNVTGEYGSAQVSTRLLGRFNVQNLLAVLGVLQSEDLPFAQALAAVCEARTVPGRMECFGGGDQPLVVVDYAHTPDALEKALIAARAHCTGQLWCVFGCGGERDRGKRPQMGALAEKLADHVIVTDDNPRHEDGDAIVAEILGGITQRRRVSVQRDRARALAEALQAARTGDVVLLAGKGHEQYQIVGDRHLDYSDRDTVLQLLREVSA